jgi:putative hydrolase of the HAD superfamily
MTGAIVFDLDGTLYPERRYALSGYAAVARHLEQRCGVPGRAAFARLAGSLRRGRRGVAFQDLSAALRLDSALISEWLDVYRTHEPRLRLPEETLHLLVSLRPAWKLGILSNGIPSVQARKAVALRLEDLVDAVVLAEEHGDRTGKPDAGAFLAVLDRLGVEPARAIFVGDDPFCDIFGAKAAGLRAIQVCAQRPRPAICPAGPVPPDAVAWSLKEIPLLVEALWARERVHEV